MTRDGFKKIFLNAALVAGFSIGAFLLCEGVVRLMFKDTIVLFPRYQTDAQYGDFTLRKIRPNETFRHTSPDGSWLFETNAQGFRNREDFDYAKPDGIVRVLVLGDSHTQGYEVRQDHTFSAIIEKYLDKNGHPAQVLNTGVSGFSTAEELLFLENEGIKYDPDFVVVGFYANDFEDNIKAGLFHLDEDGTLSITKNEYLPGIRAQNLIYSLPMMTWLGEHSYFYSMLFNGVWVFFKTKLAADASQAAAEYAIPTQAKNSSYEIELAAALLERMHTFCRARGIPMIIVDIPRISGNSSIIPELKERLPAMSDAYVDSGKLLADYVGVAELHRPNGSQHITEFSHAILGVSAAKQIDDWLRSRDFADH